MAYKAKDRTDLLSGIDEFLDQVTVLPPGEWDPTIRIEPPKNVPSQVGGKKLYFNNPLYNLTEQRVPPVGGKAPRHPVTGFCLNVLDLQMKRKRPPQPNGNTSPSGDPDKSEEPEVGPELQRTGR